jgi:uncharacterized protein YwqG
VLTEVPYSLNRTPASDRPPFTDAELAGQGWTLLAQVNEDANIGLGIGDGGAFYFVIPTVDLDARRFERAFAIMQCH